ncbi:unnamed protein product [Discosporangium mesarthrocarpum]
MELRKIVLVLVPLLSFLMHSHAFVHQGCFATYINRKRDSQKQVTPSSSPEGQKVPHNLMELDVVEFSLHQESQGGETTEELGVASYLGDGTFQPLLTRTATGPQLFFQDEEAEPIASNSPSFRIVRVLDEVWYSQRIVEDRVKNPHGEEAEVGLALVTKVLSFPGAAVLPVVGHRQCTLQGKHGGFCSSFFFST